MKIKNYYKFLVMRYQNKLIEVLILIRINKIKEN